VDEPFPHTGCAPLLDQSGAPGRWEVFEDTDNHALYTFSDSACVCRATGCTTKQTPKKNGWARTVSDDGATLYFRGNDTGTSTQVFVVSPKTSLRAALTGSCVHAAFGPKGRVFASCEEGERYFLYELSPTDLSVVGKRILPAIAHSSWIVPAGDDLLVGDRHAMLVPADWARDPTLAARGHVYVTPSCAIFAPREGTLRIYGDDAAASALVRCWDGEHLTPFASCR